MTTNLSTLTLIFLVVIRIGVVLLFTPIAAIQYLPIRVRLILLFAISGLLVSNLSLSFSTPSVMGLIASALSEFANGLILSMGLHASFAVFHIAGQLIDNQMGLNSLAILNPSAHSYEPLTARLLSMLAVLFFFSMNGHHWLLRGLAYSFKIIPPGKLMLLKGLAPVLKQFSLLFTMTLVLVTPLLVSLLAVDFGGAALTRNMPQISTYFLTLPIKILLGWFILTLMLPRLNLFIEPLFKDCFQSWQEAMS